MNSNSRDKLCAALQHIENLLHDMVHNEPMEPEFAVILADAIQDSINALQSDETIP